MKINYKSFSVEVFGENIWGQTYLNRVALILRKKPIGLLNLWKRKKEFIRQLKL